MIPLRLTQVWTDGLFGVNGDEDQGEGELQEEGDGDYAEKDEEEGNGTASVSLDEPAGFECTTKSKPAPRTA